MNKEEFRQEPSPAVVLAGPWVTVCTVQVCPAAAGLVRGRYARRARTEPAGTCITSPPWPGAQQSSALFMVAAQPPVGFGRPPEPAALAHTSGGIEGV